METHEVWNGRACSTLGQTREVCLESMHRNVENDRGDHHRSFFFLGDGEDPWRDLGDGHRRLCQDPVHVGRLGRRWAPSPWTRSFGKPLMRPEVLRCGGKRAPKMYSKAFRTKFLQSYQTLRAAFETSSRPLCDLLRWHARHVHLKEVADCNLVLTRALLVKLIRPPCDLRGWKAVARRRSATVFPG